MSTIVFEYSEENEKEGTIYMKGAAEIVLKSCDNMLNEKGKKI